MSLSNIAFREAYGKVPQPIRDYLISEELTRTVQEIGAQYKLHVDREGEFADVITETLLGFIQPVTLPEELFKRVGIGRENIPQVIAQINEKVFVPLQKEVRRETAKPQQKEELVDKAPEPTRIPTPPQSAPAPSYKPEPPSVTPPLASTPTPSIPPLVPPKIFTTPNTPQPSSITAPASPLPEPQPYQKEVAPPENLPRVSPQPSIPTPSVTPAPQPASPSLERGEPLYPSYNPRTAPPELGLTQEATGEIRTMQRDMLAVSEHREPAAISYQPTIPTPQRGEVSTPVTAQPAVAQASMPPVQAPPRTQAQPISPAPQTAAVPGTARPRVSPTINELVVREYTRDPYREPIT